MEKSGIDVTEAKNIIVPESNSSGSLSLDYDLCKPFPEGSIIEIFGEESSCKTTLALEVAGQALQKGKKVLYVNMEKNITLSLMQTIRSLLPFFQKGKDECPLLIVDPLTGEQAFESIKKFAATNPQGIAILDSIDAAQPSAVLSEEIGERKVGNLAWLLSDAMRKLIDVARRNKVTVICINQIRDTISPYGEPNTTPGGRAIKFYASQRIKLQKPRKADWIVDADGNKLGVYIRYKVIKNKLAPDGNEGHFPILFKHGIFKELEIITQCANFGILRLGGKGGKQVYLPKIDRDTGEYIVQDGNRVEVCLSQFNAARRLLIDSQLTNKLLGEAQNIVMPDHIDSFINEIQDTTE